MRFVRRVTEARTQTHIHNTLIRIVLPRQQWLRERASVLPYACCKTATYSDTIGSSSTIASGSFVQTKVIVFVKKIVVLDCVFYILLIYETQ